jgi:hypothetical protein
MASLSPEEAQEILRGLLYVPPLEVVHENVAKMWHLGKRFPVPKFHPVCAFCSSTDVVIRRMRFFKVANPATTPWRCDVYMKCKRCSVVWTYGIVIPKEMWKGNEKHGMIHRKRILSELENMDGV